MVMEDKKVLDVLEKFDTDSAWLSEKLDELRKEYPNQYIIVKDCRVIDSDADLDRLLQRVKSKGIDPALAPRCFISEKPLRYLL
jgi:hypothetical protein